jgi:hypothetical protein
LPPELLQAPAASKTIMTKTTEAARLACVNISCLPYGGSTPHGERAPRRGGGCALLSSPLGNACWRRAHARRAATGR